jgi:hypothetical protein
VQLDRRDRRNSRTFVTYSRTAVSSVRLNAFGSCTSACATEFAIASRRATNAHVPGRAPVGESFEPALLPLQEAKSADASSAPTISTRRAACARFCTGKP